MELAQALALAEQLKAALAPACTRIEIAGSVRRGKPDVHDLEIVAVPDLAHKPRVAFGQRIIHKTVLDAVLYELVQAGGLVRLKGGDKFKQYATRAGINLDLFLVIPPAQWGVLFTIRTGPAEFSHWCVTPRSKGGALPDGLKVEGGAVWRGTEMLAMPEEEDFFKVLGLQWIEPGEREARWNSSVVNPVRASAPSLSADVRKYFAALGPGIQITGRVMNV